MSYYAAIAAAIWLLNGLSKTRRVSDECELPVDVDPINPPVTRAATRERCSDFPVFRATMMSVVATAGIRLVCGQDARVLINPIPWEEKWVGNCT